MLNSNRTADPFETWHKNRLSLKVVLFVFKIFKMATNMKIKKIIKNLKMNRFQWKWICTGSKTCCTIWRPFSLVAILNQKWPPKYKNSPFWAKFGFQVDYDIVNWYPSFGSHIISYLVVFAPFLIMSPKQSFGRHPSRHINVETTLNFSWPSTLKRRWILVGFES